MIRQPREVDVRLVFGTGFAGAYFALRVGDRTHHLLGPSLGTRVEMEEARRKAMGILRECYPEISFDLAGVPFEETGVI